MTDIKTKEQRSFNMSRVKVKQTSLENIVQQELNKHYLTYETNVTDLPGKPDIVFRNEKVVIFIDGDFWHGYRFPQWKNTQSPFWQKKINDTRLRDKRNFQKLRRLGWIVVRLWQHQIKRDCKSNVNNILLKLSTLNSRDIITMRECPLREK